MRSFGLISNITRDEALKVTKKTAQFLLSHGAVVYMQEYSGTDIENVEYVSKEDIFELSDCIVTVGGDGTIIHAAKPAALLKKPIIGINCGRIGYIAELEKDEINLLEALFSDNFCIEERSMLEVTVGGAKYYCINDAVIAGGTVSKIMDFTLCHNGRKISDYRADGMVFSTPTGSTAYNLSAGGPIIDGKLRCIAATPICAHSLSSRTMIFSEESELKAITKTKDFYLTVDGEITVPIESSNNIEIKNSQLTVRLIKIKDSAFYEVLKAKLSC